LLIARGVRKFRRLIALVKQIKLVLDCEHDISYKSCALLGSGPIK
jgi:hypothetical protein